MAMKWVILPSGPLTGEIDALPQYKDPSFRRLQNSPCQSSPRRMVDQSSR
jgi:hypothetical protein